MSRNSAYNRVCTLSSRAVLALLIMGTFAIPSEGIPDVLDPATVPRMRISTVDDDATGYGTFQSHNQKVVSTSYGIFMTYVKTAPFAEDETPTWRLLLSQGDGETFQPIWEDTHRTYAPAIEAAANGMLYLVHGDEAANAAHFYRLSPLTEFVPEPLATVDEAYAQKFSVLLDEACGNLYYLAYLGPNIRFVKLDVTGAGKTMNSRMAAVLASAVLSTVVVLGTEGMAQAAVPGAQYVESTTALNFTSPKMAVAQCPAGMAALGGAANVTGAQGQVAIQAGFPEYDAGALKHQFVVKAVEDLTGTGERWSLIAGVYCTSATVPVLAPPASSSFDSNPIKEMTVECPPGMKVVGMGGQISTSDGPDPAATVGDIPSASVVFQGFHPDADLETVTARATEVSGALATWVDGELQDSFAGSWKVTAVAACGYAYAFDGLEPQSNSESTGFLLSETRSMVGTTCSAGKQIIGARIDNRRLRDGSVVHGPVQPAKRLPEDDLR